MISWTPLIRERSQFLLLSICRPVLLFYDHICTIEENINGHFKIFFIHCIMCLEYAAHPFFLCLDIACFQKIFQAPFYFWCLPWFHCTNHQNWNYHAVQLMRSSPAPTISSLLHSCIFARVLLHTGACAKAALLTNLLLRDGFIRKYQFALHYITLPVRVAKATIHLTHR